eukprot:TRINITY_DN52908_c0_g1_i1.p1 TRINITY_DN52908_c0_g1~~TRINITY_DN52908_c0_g1_i1.p1  ORF type:complete len:479 (-),score=86.13 TRINITY_DN52908_c0_g1_i1:130-1566(-)
MVPVPMTPVPEGSRPISGRSLATATPRSPAAAAAAAQVVVGSPGLSRSLASTCNALRYAETADGAYTRLKKVDGSVGWSDLATARVQLALDEADSKFAEHEVLRTREKLASSEAELRTLRHEAEGCRQSRWDADRTIAALQTRDDAFKKELKESHVREANLAVRAIECQIAQTAAENTALTAKAEGLESELKSTALHKQVQGKAAEVFGLQRKLEESKKQQADLRSEVEKRDLQLAELQKQFQACRATADEESSKNRTLEREMQDLREEARRMKLENEALKEETKVARTRSELLLDHNRRLRIDLQEALGQARRSAEIPFYGLSVDHTALSSCRLQAALGDAPIDDLLMRQSAEMRSVPPRPEATTCEDNSKHLAVSGQGQVSLALVPASEEVIATHGDGSSAHPEGLFPASRLHLQGSWPPTSLTFISDHSAKSDGLERRRMLDARAEALDRHDQLYDEPVLPSWPPKVEAVGMSAA